MNYGARQLKRKVQELIEDENANSLVTGQLNEKDKIEFYIEDDEIKYRIKRKVSI